MYGLNAANVLKTHEMMVQMALKCPCQQIKANSSVCTISQGMQTSMTTLKICKDHLHLNSNNCYYDSVFEKKDDNQEYSLHLKFFQGRPSPSNLLCLKKVGSQNFNSSAPDKQDFNTIVSTSMPKAMLVHEYFYLPESKTTLSSFKSGWNSGVAALRLEVE